MRTDKKEKGPDAQTSGPPFNTPYSKPDATTDSRQSSSQGDGGSSAPSDWRPLTAEQFARFPEAHKSERIWLLWVRVPDPGKKDKKVPHYAVSDPANKRKKGWKRGYPPGVAGKYVTGSLEDRAALVTFDEALAVYNETPGKYAGVGVGIGLTDPNNCGIDLDNCITAVHPTGLVDYSCDKAKQVILKALEAGAYIEVSPSGKGVKIFGLGNIGVDKDEPGLEIYSAGRFFTVTGWAFPRSKPQLVDLTEVAALARSLWDGRRTGKDGEDDEAFDEELASAYSAASEKWPEIPNGARNNTLYAIASFRWRAYDPPTAEQILGHLQKINAQCCKPPLEDAEVREIAVNACDPERRGDDSGHPLAGVPRSQRHLIESLGPRQIVVPGSIVRHHVTMRMVLREFGHKLYYYLGGALAELSIPSAGQAPVVRMVTPERLVAIAGGRELMGITKPRSKWELGHSSLPIGAAATMLQCHEVLESRARKLALICAEPMLYADGNELKSAKPGYNPEGGGIFVYGKGAALEDVPVDEAAAALYDLWCDYDFETPGDLLRAIGAHFLPAFRWGGLLGVENCPVVMTKAEDPGAGKTMFIDITRCIYGENVDEIAITEGGVGSFDEKLAGSILDGFRGALIDNVRGSINSQQFEALTTSRGSMQLRKLRYGATVDVTRFFYWISSNKMETTEDLARRLYRISIRQRPDDGPNKYPFKIREGLGLPEYVKKHRRRLLGCTHAIVRHWWKHGRDHRITVPTIYTNFATYLSAADWIVRHVFGELIEQDLPRRYPVHKTEPVKLLDIHLVDAEYRAATKIHSNPELAWLERIGHALVDRSSAGYVDDLAFAYGDWLAPSDLHPGDCPGIKADESQPARFVGGVLSRVFKKAGSNQVKAGRYWVRRRERREQHKTSGQWMNLRAYCFWPVDRPDLEPLTEEEGG
jgi:hypothetical protein